MTDLLWEENENWMCKKCGESELAGSVTKFGFEGFGKGEEEGGNR